MKTKFSIKAKLWVWPGNMAWHFVSLDKEISKTIRDAYPKSAMVKVKVNIENITWETSLFRNKRDENYIMPIKKQIRNKANIWPEDILNIKIEIL
jgi:hypothetical protein